MPNIRWVRASFTFHLRYLTGVISSGNDACSRYARFGSEDGFLSIFTSILEKLLVFSDERGISIEWGKTASWGIQGKKILLA
jgi:hypothetical protein